MKRIINLLLLLFPAVGFSQSIITNPPVFTAEDEVTFRIDVTGTSLEGYTDDVWIWAWIAEGCSAGCDAPTNIDPAGGENTEAAKVIRDENNPNVYTITFVPVDFFGKAPSEIRKIGLKLKSISWGDGKQSDNDLIVAVQPLIFIPSITRTFPVKFTQEDVVTLFFDKNHSENDALNQLEEIYTYFFISGTNADGSEFNDVAKVSWSEVGNTPEVKLTGSGEGVYSISFIPEEYFDITEGADITKISYIFRNAEGSVQSETFQTFTVTED